MQELTPWQSTPGTSEPGRLWLKRDDLYEYAGVRGGKVRTCKRLAMEGLGQVVAEGRASTELGSAYHHSAGVGFVTAGSRSSPQVNIVAHIGHHLGVPVRCYIPTGELTPEVQCARDLGAELVGTIPGHNSVIRARAREWAEAEGWVHIPFGMECPEAVWETARQVHNIPEEVERLVVPVGSGMSLAGILEGLEVYRPGLPVLGVVVGASPERRLDKWAPPLWRLQVELVPAGLPYSEPACQQRLADGTVLDSIYEAKCLPHLRPGDGLWCVGIRETETEVQ